MKLMPLSIEDMEQVRLWRNLILETLRTPFMLTKEQQEDYYRDVICDRRSTTRYWGFWLAATSKLKRFVGYGGIENIEWENRRGEISVLIAPTERKQGLGREAVGLILDQAFKYMNLENVHGECYTCSPAETFWNKMLVEYGGSSAYLPATKYSAGVYWDSLAFNFKREKWII